jgi:hypothetical protein
MAKGKAKRPIRPSNTTEAVYAQPASVKFDFIKSNFFRVVYANGAYGGLSPYGEIRMAIYNDRAPIPKRTKQLVTTEGKLGDEVIESRVQRDAIVREVEVDIVMTLDTARAMRSWLDDKIQKLTLAQELRRQAGGGES